MVNIAATGVSPFARKHTKDFARPQIQIAAGLNPLRFENPCVEVV